LQHHVHPKTAEGIIVIAPVFENRPGGYTRIIRIGGRKKDNAAMVLLEFVEKTQSVIVEKPKKDEKKTVEKAPQADDKKIKKGKDAKSNKTNKK
jgi:large subunit ribosomal protein L17